jgi:hypothetical protein
LGVKSEQLLTQGKVFEDEILAGAKGTAKPAEEVAGPHDHGRSLTRHSPMELMANSLILRVYDAFMNDKVRLLPTLAELLDNVVPTNACEVSIEIIGAKGDRIAVHSHRKW